MKRLLFLPVMALLAGLWLYGCDEQAPAEPDTVQEALFAKRCPTGTTACKGKCVDTQSDFNNCGACGTVCAAGEMCSSGTCTTSPTCSCEGFGMTTCTSGCADLNYDPDNCGSCGNDCDAYERVRSANCFQGWCEIRSCDAPYGDCDGTAESGCETDLWNSTDNCGFCGNSCLALFPDAIGYCDQGACEFTCNADYLDCDQIRENGCEVYSLTDAQNCGACGAACSSGQTCVSGVCSGP